MDIKYSLNSVFVRVIALASVLVLTTASQYALASTFAGVTDGSVKQVGDVDVEEAAEAGNATMAGATKQTAANGNTTDVQFLAIQRAQSGSISQINDTAYSLELDNVSGSTILFSDRPERIVTTVSTSDFVGNWTTGQDSFAADAPNDALIVENSQTGNLETAIIESFSPVYDMTTDTLTYTIMAENATPIDLPSGFGETVLVIDGSICPPSVRCINTGGGTRCINVEGDPRISCPWDHI